MSPSFHRLLAQKAFPPEPPVLLLPTFSDQLRRNQCTGIIHKTIQVSVSPLVCSGSACLLVFIIQQASRLQSIIGECNEMVMLVRTIPRPAPAFRPPALNGDNNFSSRRGGRGAHTGRICKVRRVKTEISVLHTRLLPVTGHLGTANWRRQNRGCRHLCATKLPSSRHLCKCSSPQQHTPLRISQAHRHPKRPRLALFNSGAATTQKIMGAGNAVVQQHQVGNVESIRPVEHIMMKSTDRRRIFNTITLNVQGRWGE